MLLGTAVTEAVLKTDPRYVGQQITSPMLSTYALEQRASTDTDVLKIANGMKDEYGNGASTLLRIFNAAAEPLRLRYDIHRYGNIWKYPVDMVIHNGQWSVLLVVHAQPFQGVAGGLIYHAAGSDVDLFCGWDMPYMDDLFGKGHNNKVYGDIQKPNYWSPKDKREAIHDRTNKDKVAGYLTPAPAANAEVKHGYRISLQTAAGTSPVTDITFGLVDTLK